MQPSVSSSDNPQSLTKIPCGFASPVPIAAALASLTFAFSPLVWFYSIQAEVFALNNAFVAVSYFTSHFTTANPLLYFSLQVLLSSAVAFWEHRSATIAVVGAFFIGLGLTNQHTLVFYALPLIIWAMIINPALLRVTVFLKMCAAGLVGLLPYAYLPIASLQMPATTWGDQSTFEGLAVRLLMPVVQLTAASGFRRHVLREEYGTFTLYSGNTRSQLVLALRM